MTGSDSTRVSPTAVTTTAAHPLPTRTTVEFRGSTAEEATYAMIGFMQSDAIQQHYINGGQVGVPCWRTASIQDDGTYKAVLTF